MIQEETILRISEIQITKLYGKYNYTIPIEDNLIVLVAFNGAYKTTILRMVYFLLSNQLDKLEKFDFKMIQVEINDSKISYTKGTSQNDIAERIQSIKNELKIEKYKDEIFKVLNDSIELNAFFNNTANYILKFEGPIINELKRIKNEISIQINKSIANLNILYLPTYRKIEQNFEDIYEGIEEIARKNVEATIDLYGNELESQYSISIKFLKEKLTNSLRSDFFHNILREYEKVKKNSDSNFIELTEFGMKDVKARIENSLHNGAKGKNSIDSFIKISNQYFSKDRISDYESDASDNTSNSSFEEYKKKFILEGDSLFLKTKDNPALDLNLLSSGEKQIITIFAYLLLSDKSNFIVIFDEPELSLSMLWQTNLLADIKNLDTVSAVISCTHSPYIFDNLIDSVQDLTDFVSVS